MRTSIIPLFKRISKVFLNGLPGGFFFIISIHLQAEPYIWRNVPLGGGGYVTGLVIHPAVADLMYIRTDVGGAYRWDAPNDRMIPLTDGIGYAESNLYGIDGIALAPSHPDTVYLVCGKYAWAEPHAVLKSTNRGQTWTQTNLSFQAEANQSVRWAGECIVVDPFDEAVVYCGTRSCGLWKTTDGGENWYSIPSLPHGMPHQGIRTLCFGSAVNSLDPPPLYAGVMGEGVYESWDQGTSWRPLARGPSYPQRMTWDPRGTLYVAAQNGIYRWNGKAWQDCSPVQGREYSSISLSQPDPDLLVCAERFHGVSNPIYLSQDGGKTWRNVLEDSVPHFQVPWWPKAYFAASTAQVGLDPHHPRRAWLVDWFGTWHTPDITAQPCEWFTHETGHEEMVVFGMIAPPTGALLLTALADNSGTRHADLDTFPLTRFDQPLVQSTTGLDFCEADPRFIVRVGSKNDGTASAGAWSEDNGQSWTTFEPTPFAQNGRVALSATNPNHIVILPIGDSPKYSRDRGQHWHESSGAPQGGIGNFWHKANPLAADRVEGSWFYYFEGGTVHGSEDGGATWEPRARLPREKKGFLTTLASVPGRKGEVWVSLGHNGLFRSIDGGHTFTQQEQVAWSHLVALGKPAPCSSYPTLFVYGTIHKTTGVFRSIDEGKTWMRINSDSQPIGNSPECMAGDRRLFGRVFIGTNGRGIYVGTPQ
ncbi:MAG: hypothetical protein RBU29_01840 [bacterium]|nr:hypothetical protein [bacterium]